MKTEQIIALTIFVFIVIAVIALVVFVSIRNNIYKKFVLANSVSIRKIKEINIRYTFKTYDQAVRFHHRFDNKGYWRKTEPVAFLSREIRNDLSYWFDVRDKIEFNKTSGNKYFKEIKEAYVPISKDICETNKKRFKKCCKFEKRLFDSLIKHPQTTIKINVVLRYVSAKGKVDLSKAESFDYVALNRILDSISTSRVDRETYERLATAERAMLSDSMRYDVLRRDGFRCVLCGMSAKDGAVLHVDHIIPVSKGGKTELSNLRTLCEKCNIGKSNKIE